MKFTPNNTTFTVSHFVTTLLRCYSVLFVEGCGCVCFDCCSPSSPNVLTLVRKVGREDGAFGSPEQGFDFQEGKELL